MRELILFKKYYLIYLAKIFILLFQIKTEKYIILTEFMKKFITSN